MGISDCHLRHRSLSVREWSPGPFATIRNQLLEPVIKHSLSDSCYLSFHYDVLHYVIASPLHFFLHRRAKPSLQRTLLLATPALVHLHSAQNPLMGPRRIPNLQILRNVHYAVSLDFDGRSFDRKLGPLKSHFMHAYRFLNLIRRPFPTTMAWWTDISTHHHEHLRDDGVESQA